jgi:hypothetical protein
VKTRTVWDLTSLRIGAFLILALIYFVWAAMTFYEAPRLTPWDFQAFWGGGKALVLGHDPYDQNVLLHLGVNAQFRSPIYLAEFFQPVALLPLMRAKVLWTVFNVVAGAIVALTVLRLSKVTITVTSALIAFALLIAFEPYTGAIFLGQTDILVLLSLSLSWLLLERNKLFLAGVVFCVGAINPELIAGVGLYYLYRSVWRREYALLRGMLAGGLVLAIGLVYHLPYFVEWITAALPLAQSSAVGDPLQMTVMHVAATFIGILRLPVNVTLTAKEVAGIVIAASCLTAIYLWHRSKGKALELDMAIAAVLTLLCVTFAFHQDFLILVLVAPSLVTLARRDFSVDKVAFLTVCASTFFFSCLLGHINNGPYKFQLLFYYVAPFLAGAIALTQVRTSVSVARKWIPWIGVLCAFSIAGSFLPQIMGLQITVYETGGIFLGLIAFMIGMWRWHPTLQPAAAIKTGVLQPEGKV